MTPYRYCEPFLKLLNTILLSDSNIRIFSNHDLIPSSLDDEKIKNRYIKYKIKYTLKLSLEYNSIEINYNLYKKYIRFPIYISKEVAKEAGIYSNYGKIGVQMRLGDKCINKLCNIPKKYIHQIEKDINSFKINNFIIQCITDSESNISAFFNYTIKYFKRSIKPWHSGYISKKMYKKEYILKLIGDLFFFSTSQFFLITPYSSYGLMGLYLGAVVERRIKPFRIIGYDNLSLIYDIFKHVDLKFRCNRRNSFA